MRRQATICAFVLLAIAASACAREGSLQDAVEIAVTKTREAQSWRSAGNMTYADATGVTLELSFESEFAAPDRSHSRGIRNGDWHETIVIGDDIYLRSSDEPGWCQSPCEYDGRGVAVVPGSFWKELEFLDLLVDLERLPDEQVGGLVWSHYRGKLDQDSYWDMLETGVATESGQPTENPALLQIRMLETQFELWIDGDDYVRQIESEWRFTDPGLETGNGRLIIQRQHLRFHDFNEPIAIERPSV